jgi:hypothetical protein
MFRIFEKNPYSDRRTQGDKRTLQGMEYINDLIKEWIEKGFLTKEKNSAPIYKKSVKSRRKTEDNPTACLCRR